LNHSRAPLLLLLLATSAHAAPGPWFDRPRATTSPVRWHGAVRTAEVKTPPKSKPAPKPRSPQGSVLEGGKCRSEDDCVVGTYCDFGTCVKVTYPFHIPPYLFYRSYDGRFTEILGVYWHQRGMQGYQVVFPFYWHFWSEQDQSRLVLPFYYSYRNPGEDERSTFYTLFQYRRTPRERNYRLWPLVFWTSYGERGAGLTIMPLFHFAREGKRTAAVLPWLLSGFERDPTRKYSRGLVLGLYYWHRDGQQKRRADAVLPIFFHRSGPKDSFTWVLPLNFHTRDGDSRTLMLLPLFYQSRSPSRTTTVSLVPPLYHRRDGTRSTLFALPMIYHSRDGDRSFFIGGPFYYKSDSDSHGFGLFPLLFTRTGKLTGYRVVFPVFWQFYSPYHNTTVAGPFFYRRRGPRTTMGLAPLGVYDWDREVGSTLATVIPLFYYSASDHGRRANLVSPLVLYERDDEARVTHWGLLAPPFYSRRDPDREVDALIPLGLRWHDKVDQSTTWVVGPTLFYDDPEGGTQVFFPFFWRFSDARTGAATSILFPLGYRHRRPDGTHTNLLFPFYYRRDLDGWSGRLLPVLFVDRHADHSHVVLFPVFWQLNNPRARTTILGPAYYRRKKSGWHAGIAPLLFAGSDAGEQYGVLFPAFWYLSSREEGYTTFIGGPGFYSRGRNGRVYGLLPVFAAGTWKGNHFQAVLPPLFYRSETPAEGKSFTVAGPYISWRNRTERGDAVFPVAYYRRGASSTTAFTIPLFYYRRREVKGAQDQLLVTPLGGFRRQHQQQIFEGIAGPYVWHRSPRTRGFAVLPLFYRWHRLDRQSTTTVVFPLGVHHRSPKQRALVWFPLLWHYVDAEQRALVVFPFYWRLRATGAKPDDRMNADVIFPLYWSLRQPRRQLNVIGPLFWARNNRSPDTGRMTAGLVPLFLYRRDARGTTFLAMPFTYYRRDPRAHTRTWVVGPFYHRRYEPGSATGLIPLVFHKDTPDSRYTIIAPLYWDVGRPREDKRTIVLGPTFYRRRGAEKSVGLVPLLYGAWGPTGRSLGLIPLFYHRSGPARSALYTPLFGYDRSPEKTQWYVGPYFRRRSPTTSLSLAFPLFLHHKNHARGRTTLVMPLYYGRWNRESGFHLAFPIVWYHRRIDSSQLVVLPVLWDFNDRYASRTTLVFPAVLYHRDHQEQTTTIVTPPGLWLRFRPHATDSVLFPFVWHFAGDHGSTVVFPLVWDFRHGAQRRTTMVLPLYWDIRRAKDRYTLFVPLFYRHDGPTHRKYWVVNTYYKRDKRNDNYYLMVFPLFETGRKRPGDLEWKALLGMFGYERIGRNRLLTLFFYTFPLKPAPLSGNPPRPQSPQTQRSQSQPSKR